MTLDIVPSPLAARRRIGERLGPNLAVRMQSDGRALVLNSETGRWRLLNGAALQLLEAHLAEPDGVAPPAGSGELLGKREPSSPQGLPQQLFVIYKLTHACNYSCTYCYDEPVRRHIDREKRDAAFLQLLETTLDAPDASVSVLFHGGEPLLELRTMRRAVEDCERRWPGRVTFSTQTNGSLLSTEAIDFLVDHRVGLSVSVDGVTPGDNAQRVNKKGDPYASLLATLQANPRLRPDQLGLNVTVGPQNVGRLPDIIKQMERDGFRSASFTIFHPTADGTALPPASPELGKHRLAVVGAERWSASLAAAQVLNLVDLVNAGEVRELALQYIIQHALHVQGETVELTCMTSPCGMGRNVIALYPSGEFGPCDTVVAPELFFADLEAYQRGQRESALFGAMLARDVDRVEPCRSCDVKRLCNGTCPGTALLVEGAADAVHGFECAYNFALLTGLLDRLASGKYLPFVEYCRRHTAARQSLHAELRGAPNER